MGLGAGEGPAIDFGAVLRGYRCLGYTGIISDCAVRLLSPLRASLEAICDSLCFSPAYNATHRSRNADAHITHLQTHVFFFHSEVSLDALALLSAAACRRCRCNPARRAALSIRETERGKTKKAKKSQKKSRVTCQNCDSAPQRAHSAGAGAGAAVGNWSKHNKGAISAAMSQPA